MAEHTCVLSGQAIGEGSPYVLIVTYNGGKFWAKLEYFSRLLGREIHFVNGRDAQDSGIRSPVARSEKGAEAVVHLDVCSRALCRKLWQQKPSLRDDFTPSGQANNWTLPQEYPTRYQIIL